MTLLPATYVLKKTPSLYEAKQFFGYQPILKEQKDRIFQKSYRENPIVSLQELVYMKVLHYGFDKLVHVGELIVHGSIKEEVQQIFWELYQQKYLIEQIQLVDVYDADDECSMRHNNSSAFNFRYIQGTKRYSNHAKGLAIDINPLYNPYVRIRNGKLECFPQNAKQYLNRSIACPYYIQRSDCCVKIFRKYGFSWGGFWKNQKDYQHFEKIKK